jgi:hypothetical protein
VTLKSPAYFGGHSDVSEAMPGPWDEEREHTRNGQKVGEVRGRLGNRGERRPDGTIVEAVLTYYSNVPANFRYELAWCRSRGFEFEEAWGYSLAATLRTKAAGGHYGGGPDHATWRRIFTEQKAVWRAAYHGRPAPGTRALEGLVDVDISGEPYRTPRATGGPQRMRGPTRKR